MLLSTNLAIPRRRPLVLGECMQLCDSLSTVKYAAPDARPDGPTRREQKPRTQYICVCNVGYGFWKNL